MFKRKFYCNFINTHTHTHTTQMLYKCFFTLCVTRNIPSIWFPRSYDLNEQSLQCKMYLIYSTRISLFFHTIPKQTDAIHPSWYTLKNSTAVENGFPHLQPLTNSHFHFLITVKSTTQNDLQLNVVIT